MKSQSRWLVDFLGHDNVEKQAEDFLAKLKVEYMQQCDSLNLPGTASGTGAAQQLFYATLEQKNMPWLNRGLADKAITGLIVKTPINPPKTADAGGLTLYGLQTYHPLQQYIAKPQAQSIMFDWLKNNPEAFAKARHKNF